MLDHRPIYDIYYTSKTDKYRFALGKVGKRPLIVCGLNPSKANQFKLDPTCTNIKNFSQLLGHDGFVIVNLCAQRSTNPHDLNQRLNVEMHKENLRLIHKLLFQRARVWIAWGDIIEVRPYFKKCRDDFFELLDRFQPELIQYSDLTKKGHPRHPSRKKLVNQFRSFDQKAYLSKFKS